MLTKCCRCGIEIHRRPRDIKETGNFCTRKCFYASERLRPSRRKGIEKSCEVCQSPFYAIKPRASTARFCSRRCKGIASRLPEKPCAVCKRRYKPRMGCADRPCCSRECGHKYRRIHAPRPCEWCEISYHPTSAQTRFCSKTCADAWSGRNKIMCACKVCKVEIRCSPSVPKTYCSIACRNADPEWCEALLKRQANQRTKTPNKNEQAGYALLDNLGIRYEPQFIIGGKFCVDAFLPDTKTVIQFDGDYWHGNLNLYPTPDTRQRKRMRLDRSQDAYMAICGFPVIRIWESELKHKPEAIRALLQPFAAR